MEGNKTEQCAIALSQMNDPDDLWGLCMQN